MKSTWYAALVSSLLFAGACGNGSTTISYDGGPDGTPGAPDAAADGAPDADTSCNPIADLDGDGIPSGLEGCLDDPVPRDTDADGTPDYLDTDSDNDGVNDRDEDRNGDGLLGSCTTACTDPTPCASGETCDTVAGVCVGVECLDGETDPRTGDTDGDSVADGLEGTRICNPPSEENPEGLKPFKTTDSGAAISYSSPNWRIALEPEAVEGVVAISSAESQASAYIFDYDDPTTEVAGFLATRPVLAGDGSAARVAAQAASDLGPGSLAGVATAGVRAAGTRNISLDGYDTVFGTTVEIHTTSLTDVTALRQKVVEALSGRSPSTLTFPPIGWSGATATAFIVTFQTLYRSDNSEIIFMGAVSALADYDDRSLPTAYHADDLSNGTGLTVAGNGEASECEEFLVAAAPKADIIWVLDTSGSMDDDRANVATNSTALFNYATAAGLDFRMGVTDMDIARGGIFATRMTGTTTGDRWLTPAELSQFQTNINNPSGPDFTGGGEYGPTQVKSAVTRHLPRDNADASRIREDAALVVIAVSDEKPQEIEDAGIFLDGDYPATPTQLSDALTELKPVLDTLQMNNAYFHAIVTPEPYPACGGGGAEVGWGYIDMVSWFGGVLGAICQPDLGPSMQAIIDEILGNTSPIVLQYVPISSTITVLRDGAVVPRSRDTGWDYNASANSIVFHNLPFNSSSPSEVVISYQRWAEQVPID